MKKKLKYFSQIALKQNGNSGYKGSVSGVVVSASSLNIEGKISLIRHPNKGGKITLNLKKKIVEDFAMITIEYGKGISHFVC